MKPCHRLVTSSTLRLIRRNLHLQSFCLGATVGSEATGWTFSWITHTVLICVACFNPSWNDQCLCGLPWPDVCKGSTVSHSGVWQFAPLLLALWLIWKNWASISNLNRKELMNFTGSINVVFQKLTTRYALVVLNNQITICFATTHISM